MQIQDCPKNTILEVVNLYPNEETIISSLYKNTRIIDNLVDNILDLKDQFFGPRIFDYIPNDAIIAFIKVNDIYKIVGYCGLDFRNGLHVVALCVDIKYQRNGIGKKILEKAYEVGKLLNVKIPSWNNFIEYDHVIDRKKLISNINYLTLEVNRNDSNFKGLLSFYEKCGFKTNIMPGYSEAYLEKIIK